LRALRTSALFRVFIIRISFVIRHRNFVIYSVLVIFRRVEKEALERSCRSSAPRSVRVDRPINDSISSTRWEEGIAHDKLGLIFDGDQFRELSLATRTPFRENADAKKGRRFPGLGRANVRRARR